MTRGFRVPFPWTGLSPLDGAHGDPSGLLGPSLSCVVGGCLGLSCCPQGTFWMPWLQRDPQDRPCLALLRWRPGVDFLRGAHGLLADGLGGCPAGDLLCGSTGSGTRCHVF